MNGVRVEEVVFLLDEVEDIVVIEEVVEQSAPVPCHLFESVLLVLTPEFLLLRQRHRLRVYHHV